MSASRNAFRSSYDRRTIPTIRVAFALSLLLHAAAFMGWLPQLPRLPFEDVRQGKPSGSLAVRLVPLPSEPARAAPPPSPAVQAAPVAPPAAPARRTAQRPAPAPRVLAPERPAPATPAPATPAPPPAEAAHTPAYADLASFIEARRRARDPEAARPASPPAVSEQARHNRIVAENLGLTRTPGFGAERKPGGGIFQIQRLNYTDAEFLFFGWNKDIRRNSRQTIEVQRGNNASMELAVVRRMISIIREHSGSDFLWESLRLGREVTLSARPADNAGLEDFMLREFFRDAR